MQPSPSQHHFAATRRTRAYGGAIEWEELPSLAGSLAERRRVAMAAVAQSAQASIPAEFSPAWTSTMPASLDPQREPEPFRETLNGMAMREVHEPEVFRHFFGSTAHA